VPLIVIVFAAQAAVTPDGRPVAVPIPVAPVVVCVIGVNAVLIHNVGVEEAVPTVLSAVTVIVPVELLHPVVAEVKVKEAVPAAIPVTTPAEDTVATDVLLLIQVPSDVGVSVVVVPMQIELLPVILTTGKELTTTFIEAVVAH
jgi:hypothetical protein